MFFKKGDTFKVGNMAVTSYEFKIELSDIDKKTLIEIAYDINNYYYTTYRCYEFYDVNGDFIDEKTFNKNLGTHNNFRFIVKARQRTVKSFTEMDMAYYLSNFNEVVLANSAYEAIDVCVFEDDKPDSIKITYQIKLEMK